MKSKKPKNKAPKELPLHGNQWTVSGYTFLRRIPSIREGITQDDVWYSLGRAEVGVLRSMGRNDTINKWVSRTRPGYKTLSDPYLDGPIQVLIEAGKIKVKQ